MLIVAVLVLAAGLTAATFALASLLRSQQRAHARREDLLVNQILHAAGRTWQPAPADEHRHTDRNGEQRRIRFVASPEQLPAD